MYSSSVDEDDKDRHAGEDSKMFHGCLENHLHTINSSSKRDGLDWWWRHGQIEP